MASLTYQGPRSNQRQNAARKDRTWSTGEKPELEDRWWNRRGKVRRGCRGDPPVDLSRDLLGPGLSASSIGWYAPRTTLASVTSRAGVDTMAGRGGRGDSGPGSPYPQWPSKA